MDVLFGKAGWFWSQNRYNNVASLVRTSVHVEVKGELRNMSKNYWHIAIRFPIANSPNFPAIRYKLPQVLRVVP